MSDRSTEKVVIEGRFELDIISALATFLTKMGRRPTSKAGIIQESIELLFESLVAQGDIYPPEHTQQALNELNELGLFLNLSESRRNERVKRVVQINTAREEEANVQQDAEVAQLTQQAKRLMEKYDKENKNSGIAGPMPGTVKDEEDDT